MSERPDLPDHSDPDESLHWETTGSETVYSCSGFDVVNDAVRLPDGAEAEYDYLSESPSVVVLPLLSERSPDNEGDDTDSTDREVVVIEEYRHPVGRVNRALPAGSVEPGEDLESAARRELREETGYEAQRVEPLCTFEPANAIADAVLHYHVAYGCTRAGDQRLDSGESIRVETTTLGDLREAVLANEIRDGRTAIGVLYHQLRE